MVSINELELIEMDLIAEMESLFQDYREAQVQLIEELKVTQPDYAEKMISKLGRKSIHYRSIIEAHKDALE